MPLKEQSNMALKQLKHSNFPNSLKRRSLESNQLNLFVFYGYHIWQKCASTAAFTPLP